MENNQACVWATRKALWDSFLNDPELNQAIDQLRNDDKRQRETDRGIAENAAASQTPEPAAASDDQADNDEKQNIGARLRAYETPITDEILRQSIR